MADVMATALIPLFLRLFTWSFIKAMSGEITKHVPPRAKPGI